MVPAITLDPKNDLSCSAAESELNAINDVSDDSLCRSAQECLLVESDIDLDKAYGVDYEQLEHEENVGSDADDNPDYDSHPSSRSAMASITVLNTDVLDNLLERWFLLAVKLFEDSGAKLPLAASQLFEQHMLIYKRPMQQVGGRLLLYGLIVVQLALS